MERYSDSHRICTVSRIINSVKRDIKNSVVLIQISMGDFTFKDKKKKQTQDVG